MASDHDSGSEAASPSPSSAEGRKSSKPIMEKRRRARINASLTDLKSLLLDIMKKEGTRHNKMEKADILEMTVKHLRQLQRQQFAAAVATDPGMVSKYQAGFKECAAEVSRYLSNIDGLDVDVRARLLNHLANTVTSTQTSNPTPTTTPNTAHVRPVQSHTQVPSQAPVTIAPKSTTPEVNNNAVSGMHGAHAQVVGGVQLMPSKLPGGEVAFVIPGNMLTGGHFPGYIIPLYTGMPVAASGSPVSQGESSPRCSSSPGTAVITPSLAPLPTNAIGQPSVPSPLMVLPTSSPALPPAPTAAPSPAPANNDRNNNMEAHPNHNLPVGMDDNVWRPW